MQQTRRSFRLLPKWLSPLVKAIPHGRRSVGAARPAARLDRHDQGSVLGGRRAPRRTRRRHGNPDDAENRAPERNGALAGRRGSGARAAAPRAGRPPPASFGLGAVLQEYERSGEVREIGATGAAAQGVAASSGRRRRRYPAPAGDVAGTADYALERGSGRRCVTRRQCPPSSFIRRAPHSERCS